MARRSMQVEAVLAMDAKRFLAAVRRASADTKRLGHETKKVNSGNSFGKMGRSAIRAAAGVTSVYGAYRLLSSSVKDTVKLAKATRTLQRATGLASEDASQLAAVLQVRGVEGVAAGRAFTTLARQTRAAADGSKVAAKGFRELGVAQQAIKSGNVQEILIQASDGFKKLGDGQAKAALAQQLFGRGAKDIIPLLEGGSKALREQLGVAPKLSKEQVASALKAVGAQRKLDLAMLDLKTTIGTALMPVISDAADKIAKFVGEFRNGKGAGGEFKDTLISIKDALAPVVVFLAAHPKLLRDAAAAYVAFKITLGGLNLAATMATVFPTGKFAEGKGKGLGKSLGKGLILGLLLALPFVAEDIWKLLKQIFERKKKSWEFVGNDIGNAFNSGLGKSFGNLLTSVTAPVTLALNWLKKKVGSWKNVGTLLSESFKSSVRRGLTGVAGIVLAPIVKGYESIRRKVGSFRDIGDSIVRGLASGISASANLAVQAAKDLANILPSWVRKTLGINSPSKVFAKIGAGIGEGMALGVEKSGSLVTKAITGVLKAAVAATTPFNLGQALGFGGDFKVGKAEAALAKAKRAPKGKAKSRKRARYDLGVRTAERGLRRAESSRDAAVKRRDALDQVQSFIGQLVDTAKANFLKPITDAINARSAARGDRADTRSREEIARRLSLAQAAQSDPKQVEFLNRQKTKLAAQLTSAEKRGDTERIASLQEELVSINRQLSGDYVSELEDELADFDDSVLLKKAENAAEVLGAQLQAKLDGAFKTLAGGGGITAFLSQFGAALTATLTTAFGSTSGAKLGLTPSAALGGGLGESLVTIGGPGTIPNAPPSLATRIANYLKGKDKRKTYNASKIGEALSPKSSKEAVWKVTGKEYKGYKIANKASGGRLTPGMLTMVGETGPEMIVGGNVMSGTRTARARGASGTNITINATGAAADNPQLLARELGWQLATR